MIEEEPLDGSPISAPSEAPGVVLAELVPPRPWGVWPTLGLSLATAFAVTIAQMVGGVPVMLYRMGSLPAAQRDDMAALAEHFTSDGLVLSVSTFVGGLVAIGLVVLWSHLRRWPWREYLALRRCSLRVAVPSFIGLAVILAVSHISLGAAEQQGTDFMVRVYQSAGFLPLLYLAPDCRCSSLGRTFLSRLHASRVGCRHGRCACDHHLFNLLGVDACAVQHGADFLDFFDRSFFRCRARTDRIDEFGHSAPCHHESTGGGGDGPVYRRFGGLIHASGQESEL